MIDRADALAKLLDAARGAAKLVMDVYLEHDIGLEMKGPNDPVTRADKQANAFILAYLARHFPGIPVVAEESDPASFRGFESAREALFVDPVDGTREFVEEHPEFCVMIGLAEEGRATVGVVLCPALDESQRTYGGAEGIGAFLFDDAGNRKKLSVAATDDLRNVRCAVSRFQRNKRANAKLARLGCKEFVPTGSSGVKGARVASGAVDLYAHPSQGRVKLWDACAPDALVSAAGGVFTDATGMPFDYRGVITQGAGVLAGNPILHAEAVHRFWAYDVADKGLA